MKIKNLDDLVNSLLESYDMLEKEELTPAGANARANISGKVLAGYKLKLEYHKMHGSLPKIPFMEDVSNEKE